MGEIFSVESRRNSTIAKASLKEKEVTNTWSRWACHYPLADLMGNFGSVGNQHRYLSNTIGIKARVCVCVHCVNRVAGRYNTGNVYRL